MFHLVFRGPKHLTNPHYMPRKTNRGSTHNQFELDTIRASIKSRWELHGFGTLELQKSVWSVDEKKHTNSTYSYIHKYMQGHIITVEAAADVMWFRLNYENVSKNGCKLTEIYKDLDTTELNAQAKYIETLHTIYNYWYQAGHNLNTSRYPLERYQSSDVVQKQEKLVNKITSLISSIDEAREMHDVQLKLSQKTFETEAKKFLSVIESKRTLI